MRDTHEIVFEEDGQTISNRVVAAAPGVSEAVKASLRQRITLRSCTVTGGEEDCVDIVRGRQVVLVDCTFMASRRTRQHLTIKGGVNTVSIANCAFVGRPRWWFDIVLGGWSDYDKLRRPKTRKVHLVNSWHVTGRRLRVLCLWAERPLVLNGTRASVIKVPTIFVKAFFAWKRLLNWKKDVDATIHEWEVVQE